MSGAESESEGEHAYRQAGVDYAVLDEGKRRAVQAALETSRHLQTRGGAALDASRGEPAFVFSVGGQTLAFVVECRALTAKHRDRASTKAS